MNGATLSEFVDLFIGSACCSCQFLLVRVCMACQSSQEKKKQVKALGCLKTSRFGVHSLPGKNSLLVLLATVAVFRGKVDGK